MRRADSSISAELNLALPQVSQQHRDPLRLDAAAGQRGQHRGHLSRLQVPVLPELICSAQGQRCLTRVCHSGLRPSTSSLQALKTAMQPCRCRSSASAHRCSWPASTSQLPDTQPMQWAAEHAAEHRGDASRLCVGGDSAGKTSAEWTCAECRSDPLTPVSAQAATWLLQSACWPRCAQLPAKVNSCLLLIDTLRSPGAWRAANTHAAAALPDD